jgi:hypothetical protein
MKGTVKAQHTLPVLFPHFQFDGGLNRFGTAVTEEHAVISGQLLEFFSKSDRRVGKEVCESAVSHLFHLSSYVYCIKKEKVHNVELLSVHFLLRLLAHLPEYQTFFRFLLSIFADSSSP